MLIIFLIYFIIPLIILIKIPVASNKKIKRNRILYAIPAAILTLLNIGYGIYLWQTDQWSILDEPSSLFVPGVLLLFVIIISNIGKKKERILQSELASQAIEDARYAKPLTANMSLIVDSSANEEIEKL